MAVRFASARIGENGKAIGGKPGDQTGREVEMQDWYLPGKQWYHLRCVNNDLALIISDAMVKMCNSSLVGYNQNERNTLYNELKKVSWDITKLAKKVNTDCSALVRVALAIAGILVKDFITSGEVSVLLSTGLFVKSSADKFCKSSKYLRRGDILVTRTKGHTGVIVSDGPSAWEEGGGTAGDGQNPYKKPASGSIQKEGSKGESVFWLQFELNDSGAALVLDGDFGPATKAAVKAFQIRYKLEVDGKVGNETRAAMVKYSGGATDEPTPAPADEGEGWVIDVSEYDGDIDWVKLLAHTGKNRIQFIILRCQGRNLDKKFKRNVNALNELQDKGYTNAVYGVYSYSYSYTDAEGQAEAKRMIERCKEAGARPVAYYLDSEETEARDKKGVITREANTTGSAKGWLKAMKAANLGAYLGFYSMDSRCVSWKTTVALFDGCWTARWNNPDIAPNYENYHMWQKGYHAKISGLNKSADCSKMKKGLTVDAMLAIRA